MSKLPNTIAVIDDDRELREAIATLLSASGYNTEAFASAEAFLLCASTCRAICLLVDIQLGNITGVELARQLAADGFKFPHHFYDRERRCVDGTPSLCRRLCRVFI